LKLGDSAATLRPFFDLLSSFLRSSPNLFFLLSPFDLFYLWKLGDDPSSSPLVFSLSLLLLSPRMPAATQRDDPEPCAKAQIILPGKEKFVHQLASCFPR
jgi:hypothetical protein